MSTILIAVDETHVASRLADTFKDAGLTALCVSDGHQAYRTARAIRPDLIVADYRLARLGGLELCAKLRNDRLTFEIPVVLLTANGFGTPATENLPNVKRVLTRPIRPNAALALVRTLLRSRHAPVGVG